MQHHSSVAEFLRALEKDERTLVDWAREHQLNIQAVYTVVGGRARGKRGGTREVMKAMGLPLPPMHGRSAAGSGKAVAA